MPKAQTFHEDLRREETVKVGSDRSFGLTVAAMLALLGAIKLWQGAESGRWLLIAAGAFLALGLAAPSVLRIPNRLWHRFGLLLYRVVNPLIMAVLFFLAVTPMALLLRAFGKRPLQLAFDPTAPTYWQRRDPPGPDRATMDRPF